MKNVKTMDEVKTEKTQQFYDLWEEMCQCDNLQRVDEENINLLLHQSLMELGVWMFSEDRRYMLGVTKCNYSIELAYSFFVSEVVDISNLSLYAYENAYEYTISYLSKTYNKEVAA